MNKLLVAGVALALVLGGISLSRPPVVERVVDQAPVVGALTGPDIQSPYLRVGGVMHEYRQKSLATGTTTPCIVQSPTATSTLVHAALRIGTATSSATTWTVAKNTSGGSATTTKLGVFSVSSGAVGTLVASTTLPSTGLTSLLADDLLVFSPSTYLVWGVAGVIYNAQGTIDFGGVCQAEFISI